MSLMNPYREREDRTVEVLESIRDILAEMLSELQMMDSRLYTLEQAASPEPSQNGREPENENA